MLIANIFGIFILLFLLWKILKDDYSYEKIFNLGFLMILGFVIGLVISKYLAKDYWFWIYLLGLTSGFMFAILKQKMKFFDSFEGFVVGSLSWVSLVFLSDAITKSSLSSFVSFWVSLLCIFLFFFLNTVYKSFTWYKSGKVGFSGVVTAIVFFIICAILGHEPFLSLTVAFFLFLLLYSLAKK